MTTTSATLFALTAMALTATASPILRQQTIPATCGPSVLVNTTTNIRQSGKRVGFGWIPRYSDENGPELVNVTYDMLQPSLPEPYWIITEGEYDLPGVYRIRFHNDIDLCLASDDGHLASAQECTDSAAAVRPDDCMLAISVNSTDRYRSGTSPALPARKLASGRSASASFVLTESSAAPTLFNCRFRAIDVGQCVTYATPDALVFKDCLGLDGTNTTQTWDFDQAMYA